jgi:ACR3 family arsenite efflux pump ArsB
MAGPLIEVPVMIELVDVARWAQGCCLTATLSAVVDTRASGC